MEMKWIKCSDWLPSIPKGKYSISVLGASFDPVYEEINPGKGYEVHEILFDGKFKILAIGGTNGAEWIESIDEVTHWMYKPKPPKKD
jgi:hypothetical protein